ncbi:hypothetical protein B6D60_07385 [candidate division KSB1 bacterium 4484_87]|nr:MAG: hypothetical protein B6D60_07385 [candidate division KSB1 bacterium 4484_87]
MNQQKQQDINSQLKRTLKDSFIYIPARILPAIIGIILIRVLTTLFTQEEYGHYQITLSTFGLIRVFAVFWLSMSVIRFYQNHRHQQKEETFFSTLLACSVGGVIIVTGVSLLVNVIIFQQRISPGLFSLINLAIAASVFNSFFEIFVVIYRAGLEPKKYTIFWSLFALIKPMVGISLILFLDFRVDGIFWGFLVAALSLDFIIFYKLKIFSSFHFRSISIPLAKEFFAYGMPLSFSFLAFWILSLSDRYLIEYFATSSDVGLYSVAYAISEKTLNFIYTVLMLAAFPIIVDNWEKNGQSHTQNLISHLTRYFFLLCVPILTILVTLPKTMVLIFSDAKFVEGTRVLPFIAIGIFLFGLTQYVLKGFELHKKSIRIATLALIAGFSNVGLNIFLIPRFGYFGAGLAAMTAYAIYFTSAVFSVRKYMAWTPPLISIGKILLAGFIFAIFLRSLTEIFPNILTAVFLIIPFGLILFVLILILLKEISQQELYRTKEFIINLIK